MKQIIMDFIKHTCEQAWLGKNVWHNSGRGIRYTNENPTHIVERVEPVIQTVALYQNEERTVCYIIEIKFVLRSIKNPERTKIVFIHMDELWHHR